MRDLAAYSAGCGTSVLVGQWIVSRLGDATKTSETKPLPLAAPLGLIERAAYTTALLVGRPEFIGVWLVIKTLGVGQWNNVEPGERSPYQRSLTMSLMSLGWGVMGAALVTWIQAGGPTWGEGGILAAALVAACVFDLWIRWCVNPTQVGLWEGIQDAGTRVRGAGWKAAANGRSPSSAEPKQVEARTSD